MVLCYSRHRKVIRAPRKFLSLFKASVIVPSPSLPSTVLTDTTRETCEFTCGSVSPSLLLLATLPSDHLATLCPSNLFSFHTATIHSASLPPAPVFSFFLSCIGSGRAGGGRLCPSGNSVLVVAVQPLEWGCLGACFVARHFCLGGPLLQKNF